MRWILMAIGLMLLRSLSISFDLFSGELVWLVTVGLLVYHSWSIKQLRNTQSALQTELQHLLATRPDQPAAATTIANAAIYPPVMATENPIDPPVASDLSAIALVEITSQTVNDTPWFEPVYSESSLKQPTASAPSAFERWLVGGNWIVRGGLAFLFLGLVFLSKFAYDNHMLPIELRLSSVAAFGLALLMVGWRARLTRPQYGLALQGGGVAALYLTIFASMKLAALMPAGMAFALMLLVALLAASLAIQQDALVLAVMGSIGGYLTPILLASGQGNPIGLFSYYALLNVGVLAIACYKAWRPLNAIAYLVTFGVAGLWGMDHYQPEWLLPSLAFLGLFFLQFISLSLLFSRQQMTKGNAHNAIDASLLFGVPTACFGYSFYVLRPYADAGAITALLFSATYCGLAFYTRRKALLQTLTAPWATISLLFATITVPLAFDARLTSAAWALEGSAVAWYGWQQAQPKPRWFGYLLICAGTVGFISHWPTLRDSLPLLNASSLGLMSLALAYAVVGIACCRFALSEPSTEDTNPVASFAGIALAIAGAGLIISEVYARPLTLMTGIFAALLLWGWALALQQIGRRYAWPQAITSTSAVPLFTLILPLTSLFIEYGIDTLALLLTSAGLLILLATQAFGLQRLLPDFKRLASVASLLPQLLLLPSLSVLCFWWLSLLIGRNLWRAALNPDGDWSLQGWFFPLAAALPVLLYWRLSATANSSPRGWQWLHGNAELPATTLQIQKTSLATLLVGYCLAISLFHRGGIAGIGYIPLLNLHEIVLLASLLALHRGLAHSADNKLISRCLLALAAFSANAILSRVLVHYAGADFALGFAWHSAIAATTYSIVWSLASLTTMWFGTQRSARQLWLVGASLLAVVALKLLLIDLDKVATLARIVSFISVGVLMLIVGYVAPMPAKANHNPE